jgi:hypothetical protein
VRSGRMKGCVGLDAFKGLSCEFKPLLTYLLSLCAHTDSSCVFVLPGFSFFSFFFLFSFSFELLSPPVVVIKSKHIIKNEK